MSNRAGRPAMRGACLFPGAPRLAAVRCHWALFALMLGGPFLDPVPAHAAACLIEPRQTVELASPVTGLLAQVNVARGDLVRKGQVLAVLDTRAEQAAAEHARFRAEQRGPVEMAERKVTFARQRYERRQAMAAERLIPEQERDDAEAELRLAESELKVANEERESARLELAQHNAQLALRTLRSPFDGVVVAQAAYPGEVVEPGSGGKGILRLAQLNPLRVHVVLQKDAYTSVKLGDVIDVFPEMPAGARYSARIVSIDRLIDAASGSFVVLLELPNPRLSILAGVKCRAQLTQSRSVPAGR